MNEKATYRNDAETRKAIDELKQEVDKQWAFDRRKEYLTGLIEDEVFSALDLTVMHRNHLHDGKTIEAILAGGRLMKSINTIKKYVDQIHYQKKALSNEHRDITEDMIRRAREYPFDQLIPLTRNATVCPFHEDHTPSFYVKNNRGKCYGCGWNGDTIQFLMDKDGLSFQQAVVSLQ